MCLIKMIGMFAPMNDQQYDSLPKICASLHESTFHSLQRDEESVQVPMNQHSTLDREMHDQYKSS